MTVVLNDNQSRFASNQSIFQFVGFLEAMPIALNYASTQIGDFFLSKVPWELMNSILWLSAK
ncbi:hypothetical protein A4S05_36725 [Nostoc sp. KVJ20]|nr:hypothetical protein A4S05_36725 [Nostoc sp. KVJ20]